MLLIRRVELEDSLGGLVDLGKHNLILLLECSVIPEGCFSLLYFCFYQSHLLSMFPAIERASFLDIPGER